MSGPNDGLKVKESFLRSIKPFLDLPSIYPSFIQDIGIIAEAHRFEVTSWDSFINLLISFIRHEDVRSDEGAPLLPVISWCLAKARGYQTSRIVSNSSAESSTLPNNESPSLSVFSRNEVKEGNTSDLIDRTSSKPLSSATLDAMNTHGTKGGLGRQRGSSREISPTPPLSPSHSPRESLTSLPTKKPLTQQDPPQTQGTLSTHELISRFFRVPRSPSPASTVGSKRFRKEDEPSTSHGSPSVHQPKGGSQFNQPSRPSVAAPGVSSGNVTKAPRRVASKAPSGALPRVLAAGPPKAAPGHAPRAPRARPAAPRTLSEALPRRLPAGPPETPPKILKGRKVGCKSKLFKRHLYDSDLESLFSDFPTDSKNCGEKIAFSGSEMEVSSLMLKT
ncbi:unnamed protein product [Bemisia tabaci]|uniref:Uncharacterized protein n=1 Tax=Bemisia tabaci TaxID=7038 RepID=A0A9P0ACI6_BEMTA|nr:unnamed protein product [Bemisia tabaci]